MAASKQSVVMGQGHVVMATDKTALEKGLDEAAAKFKSWGKDVAKMGAGISAAGAAIVAPFYKGLSVFSEWGAEVTSASRRTGVEFGQLQALAYATGGDMDALAGSIDKMDSFMEQLANGSQEAQRALQLLGISFEDLNSMNQHDRFLAVAGGLDAIADAGQRSAIRRQVLGRGAGNLNTSGGAEGILAREANAIAHGQAFSAEDQAAVKAYNLAQKELGAEIKATWAAIGAAVAPFMTDFIGFVTKIVQQVRGWVNDNRELVAIIFRIGDVMVTAGLAVLIFGSILFGTGYALSFVSGMIAILNGWVSFATGGFGLLTAATWAWGVGSAIASGITTAAIWLYNAATGIAHLMTWGWIALLVGLVAIAAVVGLAIAGVVTGIIWFAVYMLWSRGVIGEAWDWIVDKFDWGVATIQDLLGPLVDFMAEVWDSITEIFGDAWDYISSLFGGDGAGYFDSLIDSAMNFIGSLGNILGTVSGAVTQTAANFTQMFGRLVDTATSAWGGIKDAFAVGDWTLIWEIVLAAAVLAWQHIEFAAISTFYVWKDAITDTFMDVWTKLKQMFEVGWGYLRSGWFKLSAAIIEALLPVIRSVRGILTGMAEIAGPIGTGAAAALAAMGNLGEGSTSPEFLRDRAAAELRMADRRVAEIENQARADWFDEQVARVARDMAAQEGNQAGVDAAQADLDRLTTEAWIAAEQQRIQGAGAPVFNPEGGAGFAGGGRESVMGTFNAAQLAGFIGNTQESPAARVARLAEEQRNIARDAAAAAERDAAAVVRAVRSIQGVVFV